MDREIEDELAPHCARVTEHHHEQPERALTAGECELADERPVDLRLRFVYRGRMVNDSILMTGEGSNETSLRFAKQWMADELQTRDDDWSA